MDSGNVEALLAAPAQLVHADRDQRANQGVSGKQREDQPQHLVSGVGPGKNQGDDGIDQAHEYQMGRHRIEVGEALGQSILEVRGGDGADGRLSGSIGARFGDRIFTRHVRASSTANPSRRDADRDFERPRRRSVMSHHNNVGWLYVAGRILSPHIYIQRSRMALNAEPIVLHCGRSQYRNWRRLAPARGVAWPDAA